MGNIYEVDKKYLPKRSKSDEYLETANEYYGRVKKFLPNIPEEVLKQFFYKHSILDIGDYAWLDYRALKFFKERWTSSFIINKSGIKNNDKVITNKENHFELGYRAPILLCNPENNIVSPNGYKYTSPYHPLDGNNRLAIFLSLYENGQIESDKKHLIWVVKSRKYQ